MTAWRDSRIDRSISRKTVRTPGIGATNQQLADYLFALAKSEPHIYKSRADYRAATVVRDYPGRIQNLSLADLQRIPGIGRKTALKIKTYDPSHPPTVAPKKQAPARTGKSAKRFPRRAIAAVTRKLVDDTHLAHEIAGSYRRGSKTSGDADILVLQKDLPSWKSRLETLGASIVGSGPKSIDAVIGDIPINLRSVPSRKSWGAGLLYLTGPQAFNLYSRQEAKKRGLKLNQYGLWQGNRLVAARTESAIFRAIGLEYQPPEKR